MNNKLIYTILLILFIILLLYIINIKKNQLSIQKTIQENFASNEWTTNKDVLAIEKTPLNDVQKTEVSNMINSISQSQLKTLIATQSPLLVGPPGPQGNQGPAGTTLIASGRLVNKKGSFDYNSNDSKDDKNYFNPKYVVTRTEGTQSSSSLSFMDNVSPFVSYQNWQLDVNNNLKNRYDGNCLTMNSTQDKVYMDKCSDNPGQKWSWDSSNRIISTSASNDRKLKCIGLTNPESNILTTNIPNCIGETCVNNTPKKYLTVKDCDINNIHEDELWSFV